MSESWVDTVPVLNRFAQVTDPSLYAPLPDDWRVGASDVVDSTRAIAAGRYKAVNLVGAGTISAVTNALNGNLPLFVFGGDGARFAVSPAQAQTAAEALSRAAMWAQRDLQLRLRVGMMSVAEVRAAGFDARVAFWRASDHVRYAMFAGGGLEWVESQLKDGVIGLAPAATTEEPDLTGLSCQWGAILPKQGKILSLIVKQGPGSSDTRFSEIAASVIAVLEEAASLNPVSATGPDVRWPSKALGLQSRIAQRGYPAWLRLPRVLATAAMSWLIFKLGVRIGGFDPNRYRREIAANTDFRKFDDALMMTVDCSTETAARLRTMLDDAAAEGVVRYGLHLQDAALITCVVPSVLRSDHMHFIDGAGGGYAVAAQQMRG